MLKRILFMLLFVYFCLVLQGCTQRGWYDGVREMRRQECYESPNQDDVRKCLDSVNSATYDEYKRERESSGKQQ